MQFTFPGYGFTILNIPHIIIHFQMCHIERFHEDIKWLIYNSDHFYNLGSNENIGETVHYALVTKINNKNPDNK